VKIKEFRDAINWSRSSKQGAFNSRKILFDKMFQPVRVKMLGRICKKNLRQENVIDELID